MPTKPVKPAVTIPIRRTTEHQTFNDCPSCGKTWETVPAIPGVIHRTITCAVCRNNE